MGTVSDITVAALTATPTIRGNKLAWTYSDPLSGALPNIALDMVEVWSSTTNDRTTATKVGEGITDFTHQGLAEEVTYYYWIRARDMLPAANGGPGYGAWYPSGSTSGVACAALGVSGLAFGLANGKLVASVSSGALTVAIKTAAGNDPSASDPVYIAFRNATLATGDYQIRAITAARSVTLPSGATAGFTSLDPSRLWIAGFDVGDGTVKLAARNCSTSSTIYSLAQQGVATTVLNDAAADNPGVFYADAVLTTKPFRVLGYLDWTSGLTVAGTWTAPNVIQMYGAGVKLPGDIIQAQYNINKTFTTGTTAAIPFDDTIPQNTEGEEMLSTAITPTSPVNILVNDVKYNGTHADQTTVMIALFQDSGADAIGAAWNSVLASQAALQIALVDARRAATASQTTFKVRAGGITNGSVYMNGAAGNRYLGGVLASVHLVTEIVG